MVENIIKIKSPEDIIQKVYDTAESTSLFDKGDIKVRINPFVKGSKEFSGICS